MTLHLQLALNPSATAGNAAPVALGPRDAALLAWLALEGPTPRARLALLLWPTSDAAAARNALRQRLFQLRRSLGVDVVAGSEVLALAPGVEHDLADAETLLADQSDDIGGEFSQWLAQQRERRQGRMRHALVELADQAEAARDYADALTHAQELLALEPLSEDAHRRVMRLHYLNEDRAAALLAFDHCERVLKDEVGATPSAETLDLLAQIERSKLPTAPAAPRTVPATVLRPPRLVGRDREWALLQGAWERGEAIVLVGEAGMGKTRLLDDLVRSRAAEPHSVVQLAARPGDERVPYALLGRLLRDLLAGRALALTEGVESELARMLPELQRGPRNAAAADAGAQARLAGAIEATLRGAVASGLQAVVLDDLHFADAASLEMVQHLAGGPGLRWAVAFRGAEIEAAAQELADTLTTRLHADPIVLEPLTEAQVGELVASLGLDAFAVPAWAGALHRRTGGNPFLLLETLKALWLQSASTQALVADPGALARLPAGGSAWRLIERRISRLSGDAVRLARCAAVAGQDFSAELAAHVLDANPLDLADAWTELESAQVLSGGAFAHDLIFEAARASVPGPIARALHRRIAERMEADRSAPARLAAHWLGAGEDLRAAPHLAEAGRQALRALRMREGLEYMDKAQAIFGRAGDANAQCALIDEMIDPAMAAGTFDDLLRMVEQAVRAAATDRARSMTLRSLAVLLEQRGEYARSTEVARDALSTALEARDRACELNARALLAEVLGERCQAEEAQAMLQPIDRWVNDHGSAAQRLIHAEALAKVLTEGGNLDQALGQWQRAIDLARVHGAVHKVPGLVMTHAMALAFAGRVQAGRDALVEGRQMLHDIPEDSLVLKYFGVRLQVIDRALGHYTSTLALGEQLLADTAAGPEVLDAARLPLAYAYCDLGHTAQARRLISHAPTSAEPAHALFWNEVSVQAAQPGAPFEKARQRALQAAAQAASAWSGRHVLTALRIQARHADDELAAQAARRGAEAASAGGMHGQQLLFQALLAQRLARLGQPSEAVWLAKDSWRLLAEFSPWLVYRGVVWQALIEVLDPSDPALGQKIAHSAADWIFRTAADHVPPAYRESFLHRNPHNAFVLAKVRGR